jgi:hypothetical protein
LTCVVSSCQQLVASKPLAWNARALGQDQCEEAGCHTLNVWLQRTCQADKNCVVTEKHYKNKSNNQP